METLKSIVKAGFVAAILWFGQGEAIGALYPTKAIRMVVPVAPGGTSDFLGRLLGEAASAAWGQPVAVDNRPGAGGMIGLNLAARSPADGYTVGLATGGLAIYPVVNKNMPFDPIKDLEYIGLIGNIPNVLVVNADSPIKTYADLENHIKKNPGIGFGTTGVGSNSHMTGEMLKYTRNLSMEHVPYKGGQLAMTDLLSGNIPLLISGSTTAYPFIKSGKIRALAVSTAARMSAFPDVPTLSELGVKGIETAEWFALVAPKGTPDDVIEKWREIINKATSDPALKEKSPALVIETGSRKALKDLVLRETLMWKDVGAKARIEAQ